MKNKSVYLYCGSPAIFSLLVGFTDVVMIVSCFILFLMLLNNLIKHSNENILAQRKKIVKLFLVFIFCIIVFILQYYNSGLSSFYSLQPVFWSLVVLAFYGKAMFVGILQKRLKRIFFLILVLIFLGFSLFVFTGQQNSAKQEYLRALDICTSGKNNLFANSLCSGVFSCAENNKCSLQEKKCQRLCGQDIQNLGYGLDTSLGCGDGFKLY